MDLEALRRQLDELYELKRQIQTDTFQKYLAKPMREYQDQQSNNFFSDSLKESWRKGGRVEGAKQFFHLLAEVEREIKNTRHEIETYEM